MTSWMTLVAISLIASNTTVLKADQQQFTNDREDMIESVMSEVAVSVHHHLISNRYSSIAISLDCEKMQDKDCFLHQNLIERHLSKKRVAIIDRSLTDKIMQELQYQQSGHVDQKKAVRLGKQYGIQAIVMIKVTMSKEEKASMVKVTRRKGNKKYSYDWKGRVDIYTSILDLKKATKFTLDNHDIKFEPTRKWTMSSYLWTYIPITLFVGVGVSDALKASEHNKSFDNYYGQYKAASTAADAVIWRKKAEDAEDKALISKVSSSGFYGFATLWLLGAWWLAGSDMYAYEVSFIPEVSPSHQILSMQVKF